MKLTVRSCRWLSGNLPMPDNSSSSAQSDQALNPSFLRLSPGDAKSSLSQRPLTSLAPPHTTHQDSSILHALRELCPPHFHGLLSGITTTEEAPAAAVTHGRATLSQNPAGPGTIRVCHLLPGFQSCSNVPAKRAPRLRLLGVRGHSPPWLALIPRESRFSWPGSPQSSRGKGLCISRHHSRLL